MAKYDRWNGSIIFIGLAGISLAHITCLSRFRRTYYIRSAIASWKYSVAGRWLRLLIADSFKWDVFSKLFFIQLELSGGKIMIWNHWAAQNTDISSVLSEKETTCINRISSDFILARWSFTHSESIFTQTMDLKFYWNTLLKCRQVRPVRIAYIR